MWKFKIWEILLFLAVILLGAIAYESHKANSQSPGKYINLMPGTGEHLLDTRTGATWDYESDSGWVLYTPPIPNKD